MEKARNYISDMAVRRRRRRTHVFLGIFCVVVLICAAGSYWFFASPLFEIKKINTEGNNLVSRSDVASLLQASVINGVWWKSILGSENILVWPNKLKENLIFYPAIKSVTIAKNYFKRAVTVKIEERQPAGIWCFQDAQNNADGTQNNAENFERLSAPSPHDSASCWWFDDQGVIFRRSPSVEGSLTTIVKDYSQKTGGLNSKLLPDHYIKNFLSILSVLGETNLSRKILLKDLAREEVETNGTENPKLYFSLRFPADSTLAAIDRLRLKPGLKKLEYIDFRVENKVYYK